MRDVIRVDASRDCSNLYPIGDKAIRNRRGPHDENGVQQRHLIFSRMEFNFLSPEVLEDSMAANYRDYYYLNCT
jgi:hypothetical protein